MKRSGLATALFMLALPAGGAGAPAAGFQRITPHVFYLESRSGGPNTGIIVTPEGALLVDPPSEQEIPAMLASLKGVTARGVRWAVSTDYRAADAAGLSALARQGATVICSKELDRLAGSVPSDDPTQPAVTRPSPRVLFGRLMHLYPDSVEIRILALKGRARTAGDVIVYYPAEKAIFLGGFFVPGGFPEIDTAHGEGSAPGWIEALKQVIDFAPLLKSAMPQPRQETPPAKAGEPEKSPEEQVAVISASGPPATLQDLKDLYAAAQKLRVQASRFIGAGRSREDFIRSLPPDVVDRYSGSGAFAGQLFEDLQKK